MVLRFVDSQSGGPYDGDVAKRKRRLATEESVLLLMPDETVRELCKHKRNQPPLSIQVSLGNAGGLRNGRRRRLGALMGLRMSRRSDVGIRDLNPTRQSTAACMQEVAQFGGTSRAQRNYYQLSQIDAKFI